MHINELPDVVLARIFYWSCNEPVDTFFTLYSIKMWRERLALLAVCRIWRELALPSVHRVSFIQCIHSKDPKKRDTRTEPNPYDSEYSNIENSDSESTDTQSSSDVSDELEDRICVVKSNLDLISNTGSKCWPRTVLIVVKISNDPIYYMQKTVEKIRNHSTLLNKVEIMVLDCNELVGLFTNETASNTIDLGSIGKEISQLMPHVQYIKVGEYVTSDTFINLAQSLVKSYSHQLREIECPQYALEKVQCFSDNLRLVEMNGVSETSYMPRICAENLTRLSLNYIKKEFGWSSFESSSRSNSLHFTNLKWLRLDTDTEDIDDQETYELGYFAREFNYKVIAPKLETVFLQLCPFTLSFLASIYGLATISNVELKLEEINICFTEFSLDMARYKFASYAKISQDDFQTIDRYAYMNDIFNIYGLAKSTEVRVGFNDIPLDFEKIDWKYLLRIELYCPFHINDLKTFVSKAPSLEAIYVYAIEVKVNGELIAEIQDEAATVELISPNLKSISFGGLVDCTESETDRFMVYLSKLTLKD